LLPYLSKDLERVVDGWGKTRFHDASNGNKHQGKMDNERNIREKGRSTSDALM
jgi:hypothetical protein